MSTHPNVILMAVLTPDDLSRKTMRAILSETDTGEHDRVIIGELECIHLIMEESYDSGYQISAAEGDLVFFSMVTYGYGEVISWDKLKEHKDALDTWAQEICERHHCAYKIEVTANYW